VSGTRKKQSSPASVLVIFGASGDLTHRKILPALANVIERKELEENFVVVGIARTEWSDEDFRKAVLEAVPHAGARFRTAVERFRYISGEYDHPDTFDQLKAILADVDKTTTCPGHWTYYLATVPEVFGLVAGALAKHELNRPSTPDGSIRLVIEKPFGRDLARATKLDAELHESFSEDQIYRIDHYMGKETVQNLLALRFANAIFEPVWNRRYVDHIQITVAESLGVEHRGGFYEHAGAMRDILQNHMMQILALTLMEPPAVVDAQGIRDEKVKLLNAIPIPTPDEVLVHAARGQYGSGVIDGEPVPSYKSEDGVSPGSTTETYAAMRLTVDNWRWAGVPVYLRTGKRLAKRVTEVAMQFQRVPHLPFSDSLSRELLPNVLVLRIQPEEGITLLFGAKVPGQAFEVRSVSMDFGYRQAFGAPPREAYERLLLDALIGDPTLFIRTDEVDQAWRIVDPVLSVWSENGSPLYPYPAGSWGPKEADQLLAQDNHAWRTP